MNPCATRALRAPHYYFIVQETLSNLLVTLHKSCYPIRPGERCTCTHRKLVRKRYRVWRESRCATIIAFQRRRRRRRRREPEDESPEEKEMSARKHEEGRENFDTLTSSRVSSFSAKILRADQITEYRSKYLTRTASSPPPTKRKLSYETKFLALRDFYTRCCVVRMYVFRIGNNNFRADVIAR